MFLFLEYYITLSVVVKQELYDQKNISREQSWASMTSSGRNKKVSSLSINSAMRVSRQSFCGPRSNEFHLGAKRPPDASRPKLGEGIIIKYHIFKHEKFLFAARGNHSVELVERGPRLADASPSKAWTQVRPNAPKTNRLKILPPDEMHRIKAVQDRMKFCLVGSISRHCHPLFV